MKTYTHGVALFFAVIVLTACGQAQAPASSSQPAGSGSPAATDKPAKGVIIKVSTDARLGPILTDGAGITLYIHSNDEKGKSNCTTFCNQTWPAYPASEPPQAGEGANASLLSTLARPDGITQVTYNGWPLYQYRADQKAGDVKGQNSGGIWFVISPAGEAVK